VLEVPQDSFNPSPGEEQLFKNKTKKQFQISYLVCIQLKCNINRLTLCWNARQGRDPVHNHSR
jgi:hypothetical protein